MTGKKVSKESVNYRRGDRGSLMRCVTCAMFRPPYNCTHVALTGPPAPGRIQPMDVCDDWDFYKRRDSNRGIE